MKVAHVLAASPSPDIANGVRKYVYFLARAQAALALQPAIYWLTNELIGAIPGVVTAGFRRSIVPFRVPRALIAELERWQPDILHLHSPYFPPNATLARWARRTRLPYVITPHGALSPGEINERWALKLPYKFLIERRVLNGAAFVHAVGSYEDLPAYGVTVPVELAPCGIDISTVPPRPTRQVLEDRHPILIGKRVFLYLGRLDPAQKGLDLLLQGFAAAGLDGTALVLIGPDFRGGRARLERLAARLQPAPPILILDPIFGREKFDVVAGARVFVSTSRWEGMPTAVLEAAAAGVPSLLTAPADPLGLLSKGGGAVSVKADVAAISEGFRRMHAMDVSELNEMGARARRIVASRLSWQQSARILADAYRRHVARPGQDSPPRS